MSTVVALLSGTAVFWLICCTYIAFFGKNFSHRYPSVALFTGGVAMLVAAGCGWHRHFTFDAPAPIYLAVAPLSSHVDALASIFIGLLAVITISVALFSPGYLEHLPKTARPRWYWVELFLFIIGMMGVILAANALTFLLFWEILALTSALLIATDLSNHQSRKAAFIYLGATRISTALLMAAFLWMHALFHSWSFAQWHFLGHASIVPALLILTGLSIKAGIWPFHDWLPYAHPAAPSPVSALMSGVMIKVSLYALIRILVCGGLHSHWLAYLMLAMGLISAFWGVLGALMQHDLKTLLAYHSIENVGLILIGISLALIANGLHMPLIAGISLAAAIFHCVNHGVFKSLLFLGAGTIDSRVHTRDLEQLGGLAAAMPWTMLFFVTGSAAICALPPLNGFNSKWLVYQSLFQLACTSGSLWLGSLAMTCIAILGLVSGMALYCFTKAIGITFLGRARSKSAEHAHEGTTGMLAAQALLAALCAFLGVCAPLAMAAIQPICTQAFTAAADLRHVYTIPMGVFASIIVVLTATIYIFWLGDRSAKVKRYITWECGFGQLTERMQATASSFAENVAYTFAPLFQYHALWNIAGRDRRHFPETVTMEVHTRPILESRVYAPLVRGIAWLGERMLMLQGGSVHLYLSYILLTLVALMVIGVLI